MSLKMSLRLVALGLAIALVVVLGYRADQKRIHDRTFLAVFGVEVPTSKIDREFAMPIVQAELARLAALANEPLDLPSADMVSLHASNAAAQRWLIAQGLAAKEMLTREDQMDDALTDLTETIKRVEEVTKKLPGNGESGAEILKNFGGKPKK